MRKALATLAIAAIAAMAVVLPAAPAAAASPLVASATWGLCTANATSTTNILADSGNGWSGQWTTAYYASTGSPSTPGGVVRLTRPCLHTGNIITVGVMATRWDGTVSSYSVDTGSLQTIWTCSTSSTATTGNNITPTEAGNASSGPSSSAAAWRVFYRTTGPTTTTCPYVVAITVSYTAWHPGGVAQRMTARWVGASYLTSGYTPSIAVPTTEGTTQVGGPGYETAIVCTININTADIITTMSSFFTGIPDWATCLFTAQGWDRGSRIPTEWDKGGISRTDDIMTAVLPGAGSVVCGNILDMQLGWISFQLSSCDVANAVPTWVKTAIATVSVIALLYLFIRRVQWAVIK